MASPALWPNFQHLGTKELGIHGGTVASVAGLQPAVTGWLTVVSGTNAITTFGLPYEGFEGTIALRPTGAFTGATGGTGTATAKAIGLAFTAVVGKILFMTYDKNSGLWYPSYVS